MSSHAYELVEIACSN